MIGHVKAELTGAFSCGPDRSMSLGVLSAFLSVAEERSFTKAAKKLNVRRRDSTHWPLAGPDFRVRLLARSTRSVLPTAAGEELIAHLRPALSDVQETLTRLAGQQDRPVGRVRLVIAPGWCDVCSGTELGEFACDYPDVLDFTTDTDDRLDLVATGSMRESILGHGHCAGHAWG